MAIDFSGLFESFVSEANELLDNAEGSVLLLEQGFDKEVVNDIFRAFHTIKGDSGIFGLQGITDSAHALENMLEGMRAEKIEVNLERIDLLLTGIDKLRTMILSAKIGSDGIGLADESEVSDLLNAVYLAIPEDGQATRPQASIQRQKSTDREGQVSLRIPKRYRIEAEEKGRYLSLVYLDLFDQGSGSLLEIRQLLEMLEDQACLLMQGVLENMLPGRAPSSEAPLLPYYLLLETDQPVEGFMREREIKGKVLRLLYQPDQEEVTALNEQEAPAPESGEEEIPLDPLGLSESAPSPTTGGMIVKMPPKREKPSPEPSSTSEVEKNVNQALQNLKEASSDTHLKVNVALLDELINLAGETIIARNDLVQKVERMDDPSLVVTTRKVSYLVTKLQESIMRTRLQEIGTIFQRLPRLVRDLSQITSKQIELVTEGGDVELDKTLIDAIVDPVMHMVRNSIDHGIESPDLREKSGKPGKGLLKLAASLRGGNVILKIIDDGKGLDVEAIKAKALAKGLITDRQAAEANDDELYDLIFEPGFSTAQTITQTSGRGVGMDVVRTNFKRVGGSVDVTSTRGKGTTFTVTLPQTLSIITCLMVEIATRRYALPQQNIESLILIDPEQLTTVESHLMYRLRGHLLPLVKTGQLLYPDLAEEVTAKYIAVVRSDRYRFGLMIDEIINPEEIVVKPLSEHFSDLPLFSGAAILGDGQAVLILDVPGIARFTNLQINLREDLEAERGLLDERDESDTGYLLVGVGGNQFALPVNSVPRIEKITPERIESFMGLETLIFNEEIVPLLRLQSIYQLAQSEKSSDEIYVLIFNVHNMRVGIIVDLIKSVVDSLGHIETGAYLGESVSGQAIVNGEKTVVLDAIDLIGRLQQTRFRDLRDYIEHEKSAEEAVEAEQ